MQGPLLRTPQRSSYSAIDNTPPTTTATTAGFPTAAAAPMAAAADPTSIIVADDAPAEKSFADFFTFNSPGGFTWWAGALLGLLGCCTLASIIIIQVESRSRGPPAVMALMSSQQCPYLSSALPPVAYAAWHKACPRVIPGSAYACATTADCVVLGNRCADPRVLAQLQCTQLGADSADKKKYCAYPSQSTAGPQPSVASPGFCTAGGTTCAMCLTGSCGATTPSVGSIGCPSTSACAAGQWLCHPWTA